jgi:hypothetical protein
MWAYPVQRYTYIHVIWCMCCRLTDIFIFICIYPYLCLEGKSFWFLENVGLSCPEVCTYKLLHERFEFLCLLLTPYWLGLWVLRRTYCNLSKHHHHHHHHIYVTWCIYVCMNIPLWLNTMYISMICVRADSLHDKIYICMDVYVNTKITFLTLLTRHKFNRLIDSHH